MATTKKASKANSRSQIKTSSVATKVNAKTKPADQLSPECQILDAVRELGTGKRIRSPAGAKPEITRIFGELASLDQHVKSIEHQRNERRESINALWNNLREFLPPVTAAIKNLLQTEEWREATGTARGEAKNDSEKPSALAVALAERLDKLSQETANLAKIYQNAFAQSQPLRETTEQAIQIVANLEIRIDGLSQAVKLQDDMGIQMQSIAQKVANEADASGSAGAAFRVISDGFQKSGSRFQTIAQESNDLLVRMLEELRPMLEILRNAGSSIDALGVEFDKFEQSVEALTTAQEKCTPFLEAFVAVSETKAQGFQHFAQIVQQVLQSARNMVATISREGPENDLIRAQADEIDRMFGPSSDAEQLQQIVSNLAREVARLQGQANQDRETIACLDKALERQNYGLRQLEKDKQIDTLRDLEPTIMEALRQVREGSLILPPPNVAPEIVEIFGDLNGLSRRLATTNRELRQLNEMHAAIGSALQQNLPTLAIDVVNLWQSSSQGPLKVRQEYELREIATDERVMVQTFKAPKIEAAQESFAGIEMVKQLEKIQEFSQELESKFFAFPFRAQAVQQLLNSTSEIFTDIRIMAANAAILAVQAGDSQFNWRLFGAFLDELVQKRENFVSDLDDLAKTLVAECANARAIFARQREMAVFTLAILDQVGPSLEQLEQSATDLENSAVPFAKVMFDKPTTAVDSVGALVLALHGLAASLVKRESGGKIEKAAQLLELCGPRFTK